MNITPLKSLRLPPLSGTEIPAKHHFGLLSGNVPSIVIEIDQGVGGHVIHMGQTFPLPAGAQVTVYNPFSVEVDLVYATGQGIAPGGATYSTQQMRDRVRFLRSYRIDSDTSHKSATVIEPLRPCKVRLELGGQVRARLLRPCQGFDFTSYFGGQRERPQNGQGPTTAINLWRWEDETDASHAWDSDDVDVIARSFTNASHFEHTFEADGCYLAIQNSVLGTSGDCDIEISEIASPRRR